MRHDMPFLYGGLLPPLIAFGPPASLLCNEYFLICLGRLIRKLDIETSLVR